MKIKNYEFNKSSFLSVEKDFSLILDKILSNKRLKKLLYYATPDALHKPDLTMEQSVSMFGKHIKNIPKFKVESGAYSYLYISFGNFQTNPKNLEFRDNIIYIDIFCHYDQWQLDDLQLRPYRIAAEVDVALDKQRLTGIGEVQFREAHPIASPDGEFGGLSMLYEVIHGEEDKKEAVSPRANEVLFGDN